MLVPYCFSGTLFRASFEKWMDPVMAQIDIGDLQLDVVQKGVTRQQALFNLIRDKIFRRLWSSGGQLPSTRKLAEALGVSRNTVIGAYDQLVAEGYIESRTGAGYYVTVTVPDDYVQTCLPTPTVGRDPAVKESFNRPFAPGVPDLQHFPYQKWQRLLCQHVSRPILAGQNDIQGLYDLRCALAEYLASSRSVDCDASRIIITSGAQQGLFIAAQALLTKQSTILVENPGYKQMEKVLARSAAKVRLMSVEPELGLDIDSMVEQQATAIYITPSNQYPLGTTLNTSQRLQLIHWAKENEGWIIEDDYDSEFQFAHRPYTSLQGLASQQKDQANVVYIGTLSKVMLPSLRLGYMVVPTSLVEECLLIKDAMSGDTPIHTQAALADFISGGDLLRHIRKMRRLYQQKYQWVCECVERNLGERWKVISQAAGLHVTLMNTKKIVETELVERVAEKGVTIRELSQYEYAESPIREYSAIVLGFGNASLEQIEQGIVIIAECYAQLEKR